MKKLKVIILLLVTVLITTGCEVSNREKINCENKGVELARKWLIKEYGINPEITNVHANTSGNMQVWPDIYLDRNLTGTVNVTIKYKGVNKDVLAYCNKSEEEALEMMTRYNNRSDSKENFNCMTYDDIEICKTQGSISNTSVTKTVVYDSYNRVINTYNVVDPEERQFYKVYIPVYKVQGNYNSLALLTTQIRSTGDYTSDYTLSLTNDFKYYMGNFYVSETEGLFTIIEK